MGPDLASRERRVYETLLSESQACLSKGDVGGAVFGAQLSAAYANRRHMGFWRDDRIEDLASRIGILFSEAEPKPLPESNTILFLATNLSADGGHARALDHWNRILSLEHPTSILLTDALGQTSNPHQWLGTAQQPTDRTIPARIAFLRDCIRELSPRRIILFIHPEDIVALVAIYAAGLDKRVLMFNHGDIEFSVGWAMTPRSIEYRSAGAHFSAAVRGVDSSVVVPLLPGRPSGEADLAELEWLARVRSARTSSVSVGAQYKTRGEGHDHFFGAVSEIARQVPDHHHFHISDHSSLGEKKLRRRFGMPMSVHFVGPVRNPTAFFRACDFVVETFPMIGGTVRTEAISAGTPIIAWKSRDCPILSETDDLPDDYSYRADSQELVVRLGLNFLGHPQALQDARAQIERAKLRLPTEAGIGDAIRAALQGSGFQRWEPRMLCLSEKLSEYERAWRPAKFRRFWLRWARPSKGVSLSSAIRYGWLMLRNELF